MTVRSLDPVALADCFAELAGVFGAPLEAADIAGLIENGGFEALGVLAADPRHAVDLNAAIAALKAAGTAETATGRLNAVYCRLFLGVGGNAATLPIESAHRGNGRLFQEPVAEIADLLTTHGLRPAAGFSEPPDHLAIELALLEQLIRLESSIVGIDERSTIAALRTRLAGWTPDFAAAVGSADATGFYAALARVLVRLLDDVAPRYASAA
jgi:TorA-specific chaperone